MSTPLPFLGLAELPKNWRAEITGYQLSNLSPKHLQMAVRIRKLCGHFEVTALVLQINDKE